MSLSHHHSRINSASCYSSESKPKKMPNQETTDRLAQAVDAVTGQNIERLVSRPEWGAISFKDCRDLFDDRLTLVRPLADLPIRLLPEAPAKAIADRVGAYAEHLKAIHEFRIDVVGDPNERRNTLANATRGHIDQIYSAVSPHAAFLALQRGDIDKSVRDLASARREAEQMVSEGREHLKTQLAEIDAIMTQAREAAATAGVGHFSADFDREVKRLEKAAGVWLVAAGVFGLATATLAFASLFHPTLQLAADATYAQITQFTVGKLVLLGLFVSSTFWCTRMFRASKHQAATNRHRANALKTFQAFVKAAADDASRDAVLMETTRSIFAIAPSGYLGEPDASANDGMKIVELIRNTTSGPARA